MRYLIVTCYKSGTRISNIIRNSHDSVNFLTDGIVHNEENHNVSYWTITPFEDE